jgi:hypothetical protein
MASTEINQIDGEGGGRLSDPGRTVRPTDQMTKITARLSETATCAVDTAMQHRGSSQKPLRLSVLAMTP